MSSAPDLTSTVEQRLLAAIVFTDVAGFSSRMEKAETTTLSLLERDFKTMRMFAASQSGTVIKTTGDGLLIYFTSAVEAVEWALKTQRHFADHATDLRADEYLRHRVGIHVGDISVVNGDVMGDGVNVAARVQTEAPAGGICISQVVYGMVKNKLKLDVVKLEHRKLKNINETVQMYHVLLEAPAERAPMGAATPVFVEVEAAPVKSPLSLRNLALVAGVLAVTGGVAALLLRANREHEQELAGSAQVRHALDEALRAGQAGAPAAAAPGPVTAVPAPVTAAPAAAPATEEFDFVRLTLSGAPAGADAARARQKAEESIRILNTWTAGALAGYTKDRPLPVKALREGARTPSTVFTDASKRLVFAEGGATRQRAWEELKPEVQGAIIASLLMRSATPLTRDIVRGAEAFAYVHALPELAEKLVR